LSVSCPIDERRRSWAVSKSCPESRRRDRDHGFLMPSCRGTTACSMGSAGSFGGGSANRRRSRSAGIAPRDARQVSCTADEIAELLAYLRRRLEYSRRTSASR
jgi:hypothetical protein